MQSAVPVVDHAKRSILGEIKSSGPFNIFNIVALVAILVIGYFLYKVHGKVPEGSNQHHPTGPSPRVQGASLHHSTGGRGSSSR
jgi:hypothetical protein